MTLAATRNHPNLEPELLLLTVVFGGFVGGIIGGTRPIVRYLIACLAVLQDWLELIVAFADRSPVEDLIAATAVGAAGRLPGAEPVVMMLVGIVASVVDSGLSPGNSKDAGWPSWAMASAPSVACWSRTSPPS